jgi:hypothetical protein
MKPTKDNIETLFKLGFKNLGNGEFQLDNGWGFHISTISSIKELVKRLYVGKAEAIINNGCYYEYGGWVLIPFEKEEYKKFQEIVENHKNNLLIEDLDRQKAEIEKRIRKAKKKKHDDRRTRKNSSQFS